VDGGIVGIGIRAGWIAAGRSAATSPKGVADKPENKPAGGDSFNPLHRYLLGHWVTASKVMLFGARVCSESAVRVGRREASAVSCGLPTGLNLCIASGDQTGMQVFLYEIVARIVAIYLCVDCYRKIRDGLVEREIVVFNSDLLDWSRWISHRDTESVSYWMQIAIQISLLVSCLVVAIHGWFRP
jgi:hypothetical protein